jgi:hypothetical protein
MFQDDPTFEEFCEILRQQRVADYQQAQEDVDAIVRKEEETLTVRPNLEVNPRLR